MRDWRTICGALLNLPEHFSRRQEGSLEPKGSEMVIHIMGRGSAQSFYVLNQKSIGSLRET